MENLTWRDAALAVAVFGLVGLGIENEMLKKHLHGHEVVYNKFMGMTMKGRPLTELVNRQSLMVVPQGEAAIVCGVVEMAAIGVAVVAKTNP